MLAILVAVVIFLVLAVGLYYVYMTPPPPGYCADHNGCTPYQRCIGNTCIFPDVRTGTSLMDKANERIAAGKSVIIPPPNDNAACGSHQQCKDHCCKMVGGSSYKYVNGQCEGSGSPKTGVCGGATCLCPDGTNSSSNPDGKCRGNKPMCWYTAPKFSA